MLARPLLQAASRVIPLIALATCPAGESAYVAPVQHSDLFLADQIELREPLRDRVGQALVAVAAFEEVDARTKGRAIGLAFELDPGSKQAVIANYRLQQGEPVDALPGFETIGRIGDCLGAGMEALETRGPVSRRFADYLGAVAGALPGSDPAPGRAVTEVDWYPLFPAEGEKRVRLASSRAAVLALFMVENEEGTFVAEPVQLLARAGPASASTRVRAAGEAAPRLKRPLDDAVALTAKWREGSWPATGYDVQVAANTLPFRGDAGSGSLPLILLLDQLMFDWNHDQGLGVMGEVGEDGKLEPAGSIAPKLEAARSRNLIGLILPHSNQRDLLDIALVDGLAPFVALQVFSPRNVSEAKEIALSPPQKDSVLNEAMRLFTEVQAALGTREPGTGLRRPGVPARLRKIIELAPEHASARILLAAAERRLPTTLSLHASLKRLANMEPLLGARKDGALSRGLILMTKQRPLLEPSLRGVLDAIYDQVEAQRRYGQAVAGGDARNAALWKARLAKARTAVQAEWRRTRARGDVQGAYARLAKEP